MSIVTTGNIRSFLERGLYTGKNKKKSPVKPKPIKKTKTKNKGN
jgi:hypothetical protein